MNKVIEYVIRAKDETEAAVNAALARLKALFETIGGLFSDAGDGLEEVAKESEETADAVEDLGEAAEEAAESIDGLDGAAKQSAKAVEEIGEAAKDAAKAVDSLGEATEDSADTLGGAAEGANNTANAAQQASQSMNALGGAVSMVNPKLGGMIQMTAGLTNGIKGIGLALKGLLTNPYAIALSAIAAAFMAWRKAVESTHETMERFHDFVQKSIADRMRDRNLAVAESFKAISAAVEDAADKMRHLAEVEATRRGNARAVEDAREERNRIRDLAAANTDSERGDVEDKYRLRKIERDARRREEDIQAEADAAWNETLRGNSLREQNALREKLAANRANAEDNRKAQRDALRQANEKREAGDDDGVDAANARFEQLAEAGKSLAAERAEIERALAENARERQQAEERRAAILERQSASDEQTLRDREALEESIRTRREAEAIKAAEEEAKAREEWEREIEREEGRQRLELERSVAAERRRLWEADFKEQQKELAESQREQSNAQSRLAAAQQQVQRAWGWYRDKDSMKAQLAEEKAQIEAERQFEKDFDSLKRRKGYDWRTAQNLSVDDEAVRRLALAKEEEAAATKYLSEIEENTRALADKLEELAEMKEE